VALPSEAATTDWTSGNGRASTAQWRGRADVLVYFSNDWEGFAVGMRGRSRRRFRNE
jgi:hypothetical protein